MALTFISKETTPNYIALSTDIADSTIDGVSIVGATIFIYDTQQWYIVEPDLTISAYGISASGSVTGSVTVSSGNITVDGEIKDAGAAWITSLGVTGAAVVSADLTSATAVTDAPSSGESLVITDIIVGTDTAMNILFEEETSGTDLLKIFIPANNTIQITPRGKMKLETADKKLTAKASAAGNIAITVLYYSEA